MDTITTVEAHGPKHQAQAYMLVDAVGGPIGVVVFEMGDGTYKAAFSSMFGDIPFSDGPRADGLKSLKEASEWAHKACAERGVVTRPMPEMSFAAKDLFGVVPDGPTL